MAGPRFANEADLNDPKQVLAWVLADFPKVGKTQPYPPPPEVLLPHLSQWLTDLGVFYDPERAVIKKVRTESGVDFIPVGEDDPVVESEPDSVIELLRTVDPGFADTIEAMSPDQRKAEMLARREMFEDAIKVLRDLGGGE